MSEEPSILRVTVTAEFPRTVVSLPAWHFALTSRIDGSHTGVAVVSPEARYLSVQWAGAARITRRYVTPAQWRDIANIGDGLVLGVVEGNVLARLIAGDRRSVVATLTEIRDVETPIEHLAQTLDRLLDQRAL